MKSYWIAAVFFLVTVWSGSKASAIGAQQASADSKPVQQAQSYPPPPSVKNRVQASVTVNPAAAAASAVATSAPAERAKPKGSYMLVELSNGLKAKKLKVGDKVKAEVAQDVVSHGKVIIPVETRLVGHVTEVSARDSAHPESRLGIVFDRILLKHFHDIDFEAVVQAVSQPVIRRSRVDEPSQMLPPSMIGGGPRDSTSPSGGRGVSSNSSRNTSSTGASNNASLTNLQAPITVRESPSTHAETSGAMLEVPSNGKPLSVGMPQGVFGLKGLSLSTEPSPSTPGPVIVSNTDNVRLDSGTQILLRILKVEVPANLKPEKKPAK
ncbi:MAG TPA: hypothetical protein VLA83_20905 [Candidatus Binatia bacterium]|nr:hypothetical protein [Candidatus Binatia bacterium]